MLLRAFSSKLNRVGLLVIILFVVLNQAEARIESQHEEKENEIINKQEHDKDSKENEHRHLKPHHVQSFKHLKQLLARRTMHNQHRFLVSPSTSADLMASNTSTGSVEHSTTNVQVEGVDEGDQVKTDGQYIYAIQSGKVRIVRAYPVTNMMTDATLEFDNSFSPIELYSNDNQLVVIGTEWETTNTVDSLPDQQNTLQISMPLWMPYGESRTVAKIYDLTDPTNPLLVRELAFTGNYLSSRKIGNAIYMVGRKYPNYYFRYFLSAPVKSQGIDMTRENTLPQVSDSVVDNGLDHDLSVSKIYYFPNFVEPDYVIVAGIKLDALAMHADVKAYLGGGDIAYASNKNLYLSAADYQVDSTTDQSVSAPVTHLYKFALDQGLIAFDNAGEVPGTPLNQFSMDENNDVFRIATTVDQWTQSGDTGSLVTWNNVYTLDSSMQIMGRLEHIAEGERIVSARFIGDRSYMVTFQQIDPLFVIDLSIPQAPIILGELKMPGFSTYLHPYDENHIIGFGQGTKDTEYGTVTTGVQLALYDVTDVTNPTQLHSLNIGDQGSYSPILYDHKALLFDKNRSLIGFPINITEQKVGEEWPAEVFQGAQLYQVSITDGFVKKAAITHQQDGQAYDWYAYVNRLLTIGDQLYTLSESKIQANDLTTFDLTGALNFPVAPPPSVCEPVLLTGSINSAGAIAKTCTMLD